MGDSSQGTRLCELAPSITLLLGTALPESRCLPATVCTLFLLQIKAMSEPTSRQDRYVAVPPQQAVEGVGVAAADLVVCLVAARSL